jgi:S1-C subfamily serine protease
MYGQKETLYNVLDLPRNAKPAEVTRAYERLRDRMKAEGAAMDPRKLALLHEAHEVLSNPDRRAAYDKSLRSDSFLFLPEQARIPWKLVGIAVAAVLGAIVLYFMMRDPPPPPPSKSKEILASASASVGRVQNVDVGGNRTPAGIATTTDDKVMITTCHGIRGGSQLLISNGQAAIGGQIVLADQELDLCKLAVDTSRPPLKQAPMPKVGDKVYALGSTAAGEFTVSEGTVKELVQTPQGPVIETTILVPAFASGGPLLDAYGKIVGITVAPHNYGAGRNIAVPISWVKDMRQRDAEQHPPAKAPQKPSKRR